MNIHWFVISSLFSLQTHQQWMDSVTHDSRSIYDDGSGNWLHPLILWTEIKSIHLILSTLSLSKVHTMRTGQECSYRKIRQQPVICFCLPFLPFDFYHIPSLVEWTRTSQDTPFDVSSLRNCIFLWIYLLLKLPLIIWLMYDSISLHLLFIRSIRTSRLIAAFAVILSRGITTIFKCHVHFTFLLLVE